MPLSEDPTGKVIGFIGLGAIGKNMAAKTKPWEMKIIYHNRSRLPEDEERKLDATYVSLDELYTTADVISINTPLTPETRHLLNDEAFAKMKDGVYIVNTARGAVIDEDALVRALDSGKVARAGLDVFDPEPKLSSALFSSDRVTLQPHVGAFTRGTIHRGERDVFANVKA
ncbi:Putative 2-hydroxyacid dehydrogenasec [Vanrija pseudolonga]|uniref:2-hydroxyacid dehydrogenasec n=1 Tax=Vanrija pseudolonga TaxID=143232 RepID=A0AAF0Y7F2_9TREE|nr:Putative 2-hydroxyacid dehydrogenasec [Vanrija pseudolonga]